MLLNQMIRAGQFCEFIVEINDIVVEEKHWEFYLHKVFEMSFADYLKSVRTQTPAEPEIADMKKVETTVKNSMDILKEFDLN
jgi:hypothetical protein